MHNYLNGKNIKYLPFLTIFFIIVLYNTFGILLEISKRKLRSLISTDMIYSLIILLFKKFLTVSTSGSSGMQKSLQKKLKSSNKQKQKQVEDIFSKIPEGYDFMNDIMSIGLHRLWKDEFVNLMNLKKEQIILDVASGSGDLIKLIKENMIVLV